MRIPCNSLSQRQLPYFCDAVLNLHHFHLCVLIVLQCHSIRPEATEVFGVFVCGTASYDNKASFVDRLAAKVSISVLLRQTEPKSITPTRFRYAVSYRVISCHAGWEIWMKSKFGGRFWAVRSWPSLKQLLQLCHPRMIGTRKEKCMHKVLSSTSALHTGWTHRT